MAELEPLQEYSRNQSGGCRQVQKKRTIVSKRVKKEPVHFIWDCPPNAGKALLMVGGSEGGGGGGACVQHTSFSKGCPRDQTV